MYSRQALPAAVFGAGIIARADGVHMYDGVQSAVRSSSSNPGRESSRQRNWIISSGLLNFFGWGL